MERSRVLVTGGTGFIGRQVVPLLCAEGCEVHVVSSRPDVRFGRAGRIPPGRSVRSSRPGCARRGVGRRPTRASCVVIRSPARSGATSRTSAGWRSEPRPRWTNRGRGDDVRCWPAVFRVRPGGGRCSESRRRCAPESVRELARARSVRSPSPARTGLGDRAGLGANLLSAYGPGETLPGWSRRSCGVSWRGRRPRARRDARSAITSRRWTSRMRLSRCSSPIFRVPVNVGSGEEVTLRELVETAAEIVGRPDLPRFGGDVPPPDDPPCLVADVARARGRRLDGRREWSLERRS